MKKLKFVALMASILCAAALATACTGDATDTDTTAASTTSAVTTAVATDEATERATEPETDPVTEAATEENTEAATEETTVPETTAPETECHVLFEDDFSGAELDATKWKVGTTEDQPTVQYNTALWDPSMVALDGEGHLVLTSEWDSEARGARSGAVITKGTFEAGYGYYEASIQFPLIYGRSNHFSIVTENASIDIMRSENGLKKVFYEHRLTQGETVQTLDALRAAYVNIYDGRFHTFGVLRSAEGHTFYVDGQQTGFVPATDFTPTSEDGYLALFWEALKTDGAGRGSEGKFDIPAKMIIDRVRVYSSLPEAFDKAENAEAQILLTDDFDGNEIDFTKWKYAPEWTRNDYCYWSNEMSVLDGEGHLATKMEWDHEVNRLKSGALWSAADYGYGYYEASIRFPKAYGTWGAFWMMCGDVWMESAADGVEIDIVESINNQDGLYQHALHSNYGNLNSLGPEKLFMTDVYDGNFHRFGLLRAENGYFFYVDGKLSAIVPYYLYTPCPVPGRMELTVEADGWAGAATPESLEQLPAQMLTDYVRVWDSVPELN